MTRAFRSDSSSKNHHPSAHVKAFLFCLLVGSVVGACISFILIRLNFPGKEICAILGILFVSAFVEIQIRDSRYWEMFRHVRQSILFGWASGYAIGAYVMFNS